MKKHFFPFIALLFKLSFFYSQTSVTFLLEEFSEDHENIGIRGNIPPLDWGRSIPLVKQESGFSVSLNFESSYKELEFKFVQYTDDSHPTWEGTQNRTLSFFPDTSLVSTNVWNKEQIIDVSALKPIPSEDLLEDFELIKTMVLEVHPGTFRYNSEEQIRAALAKLQQTFSQAKTHGEAYLAMSELTATIQCDHTKVGFNNQGKIINSIIHAQKDKIPFAFKWIGNQMIVTYNASQESSLRRGTAVLSINRIPVGDIQTRMLPYIGADGATDGNRIYKMEVSGYDFRYQAFDIFFPLLYPLTDDSLTLEIQDYETKSIQTVRVAYLEREERAKLLAARYPDFPKTRDDLWNFEIIADSIAHLSINSFGLHGWKAMTIDYKQFLANTFEQLRTEKVRYLIIDIRNNTGGADEMANELFSYLAAESYNFEREGRTRYLTFPESLKPYVQTWGDNPWYFELHPEDETPTDGYYLFRENYEAKQTSGDRKLFDGKVYLLTSAANTSLAYYTARRFKGQQIGTIIGRETGGNMNDINGGQILFLRLPHSKIEIDFPVMGGFTLEKQANTGVMPDIKTTYSRDDLVKERDVEIETVLKMIK